MATSCLESYPRVQGWSTVSLGGDGYRFHLYCFVMCAVGTGDFVITGLCWCVVCVPPAPAGVGGGGADAEVRRTILPSP